VKGFLFVFKVKITFPLHLKLFFCFQRNLLRKKRFLENRVKKNTYFGKIDTILMTSHEVISSRGAGIAAQPKNSMAEPEAVSMASDSDSADSVAVSSDSSDLCD
jgi:hypothetical protein